jgi:hypothetical protein
MALDGGGWVSFGNPPSLQIADDLTVAAFVRASVFPPSTDHGYIVGKTSNLALGGWRLATASANGLVFGMTVAAGEFDITPSRTLPSDTWVHLAVVVRAGSVAFYMDGNLMGAGDAGALITNSTSEVRIGARADGISSYTGEVDEVRLYARALSDVEIRAIAQK